MVELKNESLDEVCFQRIGAGRSSTRKPVGSLSRRSRTRQEFWLEAQNSSRRLLGHSHASFNPKHEKHNANCHKRPTIPQYPKSLTFRLPLCLVNPLMGTKSSHAA